MKDFAKNANALWKKRDTLEKKLANPNFIQRASIEVKEKTQSKLTNINQEITKYISLNKVFRANVITYQLKMFRKLFNIAFDEQIMIYIGDGDQKKSLLGTIYPKVMEDIEVFSNAYVLWYKPDIGYEIFPMNNGGDTIYVMPVNVKEESLKRMIALDQDKDYTDRKVFGRFYNDCVGTQKDVPPKPPFMKDRPKLVDVSYFIDIYGDKIVPISMQAGTVFLKMKHYDQLQDLQYLDCSYYDWRIIKGNFQDTDEIVKRLGSKRRNCHHNIDEDVLPYYYRQLNIMEYVQK